MTELLIQWLPECLPLLIVGIGIGVALSLLLTGYRVKDVDLKIVSWSFPTKSDDAFSVLRESRTRLRWVLAHSLVGGLATAAVAGLILHGPAPPAPSQQLSANPLHDVAAKWRLARSLYASPFRVNCEIAIVRYQTAYAEQLASDLKEVLDTVGWKYHQAFAAQDLPRALSLRSFEGGPSRPCANALFELINRSGLYWSTEGASGNLGVSLNWIPESAVPPHMKECSDAACVELGVGNEPGS